MNEEQRKKLVGLVRSFTLSESKDSEIARLTVQNEQLTESNRQLRESVEAVEMENKRLSKENDRLREQLSAQTNTITALCLAIDPDCKHGPETAKLADYAIKTRKLALDIATNPLGNLNYVASKQREIRQHLDFEHAANGGITTNE